MFLYIIIFNKSPSKLIDDIIVLIIIYILMSIISLVSRIIILYKLSTLIKNDNDNFVRNELDEYKKIKKILVIIISTNPIIIGFVLFMIYLSILKAIEIFMNNNNKKNTNKS